MDAFTQIVTVLKAASVKVQRRVSCEQHSEWNAHRHHIDEAELSAADLKPKTKPRIAKKSAEERTDAVLRTNSAFPFGGKGLQGIPAPGRIKAVDMNNPTEVAALLGRGWHRV